MPFGGAGDLEVHVAEEVLETLDVGEDHGLALLLDQAHGDTGDGALDGHAAVHKGERGAAGRSHREEPLDSMTSETTRMA